MDSIVHELLTAIAIVEMMFAIALYVTYVIKRSVEIYHDYKAQGKA